MSEQEPAGKRTKVRPKPRRPANPEMRGLNISISEQTYMRLGVCSDHKRISRGQVVELALLAYLTGYKACKPGADDGEDATAA